MKEGIKDFLSVFTLIFEENLLERSLDSNELYKNRRCFGWNHDHFILYRFCFIFIHWNEFRKALNSQTEASSFTPTLILLAVFLSIGLVTLIGALKVKSKASRIFYRRFCLSLGICFIIVCLFSLGALGNQSERFILFVGIVYLGLGFLTKRKKN